MLPPSIVPQWDDMSIRREDGVIRSVSMRYNIFGVAEAWEAEALLQQHSHPVIFGNLYRVSSFLEERKASRFFEGTVEYEYKNIAEEFTISFDTTGGTQRITQSYETRGMYAPPDCIAPNHYGAIEVNERGVNGCEVITSSLGFTISQTRTGRLMFESVRFFATMTGRVNAGPFLGFLPGDVLFEGANGAQKFSSEDEPTFDLSMKFRVSPTVYDLQVGDIQVGYKRGWDYFWVQYIEMEDLDARTIVQRPTAAYVERVYLEADLNQLLTPTIIS